MSKTKDVFKLLELNNDGLFKIVNFNPNRIFRLTDKLYVEELINESFESSIFNLCDLLNGTLAIIAIRKEDI